MRLSRGGNACLNHRRDSPMTINHKTRIDFFEKVALLVCYNLLMFAMIAALIWGH
jgi:hypothetical protein